MSGDRFRPSLPKDLQPQVERAAKLRGISVSEFVEAAVGKQLKTDASRAGRAADLKADRQLDRIDHFLGDLDAFIGRFNALLETTATSIPKKLKSEFDALKTTISNTGGTGHLRDLLKQLIADFEGRQNDRLAKLERAYDQSAEHQTTRIAIAKLARDRFRDRWMAGSGALACILTIAAIGFLFADTAPTRWAAMRLMGESTYTYAGAALSAKNPAIRNRLIQTRSLLGTSEEFTKDYGKCIDLFAAADAPVECRLRFDPSSLGNAPPSP